MIMTSVFLHFPSYTGELWAIQLPLLVWGRSYGRYQNTTIHFLQPLNKRVINSALKERVNSIGSLRTSKSLRMQRYRVICKRGIECIWLVWLPCIETCAIGKCQQLHFVWDILKSWTIQYCGMTSVLRWKQFRNLLNWKIKQTAEMWFYGLKLGLGLGLGLGPGLWLGLGLESGLGLRFMVGLRLRFD